MPIIKPISELRNYPDVLKNVSVGTPVYLTKNGTGRYVILDMNDYGRCESVLRLAEELRRGKRSGETQGWLSHEDVVAHFRSRAYA